MTLKDDTEFEIAQAIGELIESDTELQAYCLDKLGANMTVINNANANSEEVPPFAVITKDVTQEFVNKDVESSSGTKGEYPMTITFVGAFKPDRGTSELPAEYSDILNNVKTWNPTDIMRKIAHKVKEEIVEKIGCKVSGVLASSPSVVASEYMSENYEDGIVESLLTITLYKKRTFN